MTAIRMPAVPVPTTRPWWREPMMWLVLGGPAVVVVAGIATFVIAASQPDPLIADDYYRRGLEINKTMAERAASATAPVPAPALRPAMQARNHAATPVQATAADAPTGAAR